MCINKTDDNMTIFVANLIIRNIKTKLDLVD